MSSPTSRISAIPVTRRVQPATEVRPGVKEEERVKPEPKKRKSEPGVSTPFDESDDEFPPTIDEHV